MCALDPWQHCSVYVSKCAPSAGQQAATHRRAAARAAAATRAMHPGVNRGATPSRLPRAAKVTIASSTPRSTAGLAILAARAPGQPQLIHSKTINNGPCDRTRSDSKVRTGITRTKNATTRSVKLWSLRLPQGYQKLLGTSREK